MEYIEDICKMLGTSKEKFIDDAVNKELKPYLDENGKFNPIPAILIPIPFEVRECKNKGVEAKETECLILRREQMFDGEYFVVFSEGEIMSVPSSHIKRTKSKSETRRKQKQKSEDIGEK